MQDELEVFKQIFRPRLGRCNACQYHTVMVDENEEVVCWCHLEEHERESWFPGMHLDSCIFPPSKPDEYCACFVKREDLP